MQKLAAGSALSLATALVLSGCVDLSGETDLAAPPAGSPSPALSIVVSTTVLGGVVSDIARCAEGDDQAVTVVMPVGVDPHDFQPSSAQVASMVAADLVIVNGLGLEEGLLPALDSIGSDGARVLEIGELIDPLPFGAEAEEHSEDEHHDDHADEDHSEPGAEEDDHAHGAYDPHFWMDMDRMAAAARLICISRSRFAGGPQASRARRAGVGGVHPALRPAGLAAVAVTEGDVEDGEVHADRREEGGALRRDAVPRAARAVLHAAAVPAARRRAKYLCRCEF